MSNLIPEPMSREQFVEVLTDVLERVRAGDSYEGNIEYHWPAVDGPPPLGWGKWPTERCDFWVTGVYRIGNLDGQGSMRIIGSIPQMEVRNGG